MPEFLIGKENFLKTNLNSANYQQLLLLLYRPLVLQLVRELLHGYKGSATELNFTLVVICNEKQLQFQFSEEETLWRATS